MTSFPLEVYSNLSICFWKTVSFGYGFMVGSAIIKLTLYKNEYTSKSLLLHMFLNFHICYTISNFFACLFKFPIILLLNQTSVSERRQVFDEKEKPRKVGYWLGQSMPYFLSHDFPYHTTNQGQSCLIGNIFDLLFPSSSKSPSSYCWCLSQLWHDSSSSGPSNHQLNNGFHFSVAWSWGYHCGYHLTSFLKLILLV